ncbi:MAG: hypothetical protein VW268_04135 [Rhodospirillaceae bacterium]
MPELFAIAFTTFVATIGPQDVAIIFAVLTPKALPAQRRRTAVPGLIKPKYYDVDPNQGFNLHLLHEEPDHRNAVFLFAWAPGGGTPAHNHKTWGVVVGVEGEEKETWWLRHDDGKTPGYAKLEKQTENIVRPDDTSGVLPEDEHTVQNNLDRVTLSLHTYGKHINFTGWSSFDPENDKELPYSLVVN